MRKKRFYYSVDPVDAFCPSYGDVVLGLGVGQSRSPDGHWIEVMVNLLSLSR